MKIFLEWNWKSRELRENHQFCCIRMDPGSGDLGEIVYSGLPGNTVGMATMVDMSEASKQKSESCSHILVQIGEGNKSFQNLFHNLLFSNTYRQDTFRKIPNYNQSLVDKLKWRKSLFDLFFKGNILKYCLGNKFFFQRYKVSLFIKAPTMNECEEARGLRSFAFQKDSNYSKNLLERSV